VEGIDDLQAQYVKTYGPGNYVPPVAVIYWAFRGMFLPGVLMVLMALLGLYFLFRKRLDQQTWFLRLLPFGIALPYIANSSGWILTEVGRQPWIVVGLMKTQDGVSPVAGGVVLFSLLAFVVMYAALMVADVYLLRKYARQEMSVEPPARARK
jgi:cytochrome d ubiquinol oxidase subunit I